MKARYVSEKDATKTKAEERTDNAYSDPRAQRIFLKYDDEYHSGPHPVGN